ncbi:MAG: FAD binding domain-containing protein [Actinomycetota bacterium]
MTHHVQVPGTRVDHVVTPATLDEALELLSRPETRPVAGGTDLLVELDRGERGDVRMLVDLTRIAGLDTITEADGIITLGPLVTHNQVVASELCRLAAAPLVQACWEVGSPQLRNRATIAGNVVTASPANDTLSPLVALDASVTLTSRRGSRTMLLSQFHRGVRKTAIEPDELLTSISFPALDRDSDGIYLKLGLRRAQAISVVHVAVVCRLSRARTRRGTIGRTRPQRTSSRPLRDGGLRIESARIALGSVGPTIVRAVEAERLLDGSPFDDEVIAAAATAAADAVSPIDDLRAPADYRRDLVAEMVSRALAAIHDGRGIVPEAPALLWGRTDGRWPAWSDQGAEQGPDTPIVAVVNGEPVATVGAGDTLLDWLRTTGATGVKEGCAEGECGSCTVHVDGMAVLGCLVPATRAHGTTVTTIEGLAATAPAPEGQDNGSNGPALHPLQAAFVATGAVQCGFCIPGLLMSGAKLLEEHPAPNDAQIKAGLSGNLCRCTGYYRVEDAVRVAIRDGGDEVHP